MFNEVCWKKKGYDFVKKLLLNRLVVCCCFKVNTK